MNKGYFWWTKLLNLPTNLKEEELLPIETIYLLRVVWEW
jgi:hypothetical protein